MQEPSRRADWSEKEGRKKELSRKKEGERVRKTGDLEGGHWTFLRKSFNFPGSIFLF